MIKLSPKTIKLIDVLFSESLRSEVEELIVNMCSEDLPFCENKTPEDLERIRFSVLRLSSGQIDKLCDAIDLAQTDWRDLLMSADFGDNVEMHIDWYESKIER